RGVLCLLGLAAERAVGLVAHSWHILPDGLRLVVDARSKRVCGTCLRGLWRHLHRRFTGLAMGCGGQSPGRLGSGWWVAGSCCRGGHPLRAKGGVILRAGLCTMAPLSTLRNAN